MRREVGFAAAIVGIPLFLRLHTLLWDRGLEFSSRDLRGVAADLLVGFIAVALLIAASKASKWLAVTTAAGWALLNCGAYEHFRALEQLPRLDDMHFLTDKTFLQGSLLHSSEPVILVALVALSIFATWRYKSEAKFDVRVAVHLTLAVACAVMLFARDISPKTVTWRQENVLIGLSYDFAHMVARSSNALAGRQSPGPPTVSTEIGAKVDKMYTADLSGKPRLKLPGSEGTKPNVLLILLESVSGAHIETVRGGIDVGRTVNLPYLNELARNNTCYRNYIVHQCQTNRGTYAILSGDLPYLNSHANKFSRVVIEGTGTQSFLPTKLQRHGYKTIYIQAAPLTFMAKDRFMQMVGFEEVTGNATFKNANARGHWGVDDVALFEQASEILREQTRGDRPWFATLLTAGTHHPYTVPKSFSHPEAKNARERALFYCDLGMRTFMTRLKEENLLENTLVMVSSDESFGTRAGDDRVASDITKHWGFAITIDPGGRKDLILDAYGQSDFPLSVCDYLGIDVRNDSFSGRSMFRKYSTKRHMVFGNFRGQFLGVFTPEDQLHVFNDQLQPTYSYRVDPSNIFHATVAEDLPSQTDFMRLAVYRSDSRGVELEAKPTRLTIAPDEIIVEGSKLQNARVIGGQYMSVLEDSVLHVKLDLTINTTPNNEVVLNNQLEMRVNPNAEFHRDLRKRVKSEPMKDSDKFRVEFMFRTGGPNPRILVRQKMNRKTLHPVTVKYKNATMEIVPYRTWLKENRDSIWSREFRVLESTTY